MSSAAQVAAQLFFFLVLPLPASRLGPSPMIQSCHELPYVAASSQDPRCHSQEFGNCKPIGDIITSLLRAVSLRGSSQALDQSQDAFYELDKLFNQRGLSCSVFARRRRRIGLVRPDCTF